MLPRRGNNSCAANTGPAVKLTCAYESHRLKHVCPMSSAYTFLARTLAGVLYQRHHRLFELDTQLPTVLVYLSLSFITVMLARSSTNQKADHREYGKKDHFFKIFPCTLTLPTSGCELHTGAEAFRQTCQMTLQSTVLLAVFGVQISQSRSGAVLD